MDLRKIKYFLTVAEELSFTRAARLLHISQPPLSYQIRALEDELGTPLFSRDGRHIRLTPAGAALAQRASTLLADLSNTVDHVRSIARCSAGHIRIGVNPSVMWTPFLKQLQAFMKSNRDITWSLIEGSSEALHAAFLKGDIDLGLWRTRIRAATTSPPPVENVLISEPIVALVSASHPLAQRGHIPFPYLEKFKLLTLECEKSQFAQNIVDRCRAAGFEPQVQQVRVAPETLISMASAGLGIALAPQSIANITWPGISVVQISPDGPRADVYMARSVGASNATCGLYGFLARRFNIGAPD